MSRETETAQKPKALVDVAVLVVFWARPETLSEVFSVIRQAKPSKLFLYQDGCEDERHMERHQACRKLVENVDWECEVYRQYETTDYGSYKAMYLAQKWMFGLADSGIVLEDDDKPSVSFFAFCKELLDRYAADPRVYMITGLNHEEITKDISTDYFFANNYSGWGYATWRRVVELWDDTYSVCNDMENRTLLQNYLKDIRYRKGIFEDICHDAKEKRIDIESIVMSSMLLNSGLSVIPTRNMIQSIGLSELSVNYPGKVKYVPHKERRLFTMPTYEVTFPLNHPKYVIQHTRYCKRVYDIMDWNHPIGKRLKRMESFLLRACYGGITEIRRMLKKARRR